MDMLHNMRLLALDDAANANDPELRKYCEESVKALDPDQPQNKGRINVGHHEILETIHLLRIAADRIIKVREYQEDHGIIPYIKEMVQIRIAAIVEDARLPQNPLQPYEYNEEHNTRNKDPAR